MGRPKKTEPIVEKIDEKGLTNDSGADLSNNENPLVGQEETKTMVNDNESNLNANNTMESEAKQTTEVAETKAVKLSQVSHKDDFLLVKNTNKEEQVVPKQFWINVRDYELDRLQGFELIGKVTKLPEKEGDKIEFVPVEDDYEVAE